MTPSSFPAFSYSFPAILAVLEVFSFNGKFSFPYDLSKSKLLPLRDADPISYGFWNGMAVQLLKKALLRNLNEW